MRLRNLSQMASLILSVTKSRLRSGQLIALTLTRKVLLDVEPVWPGQGAGGVVDVLLAAVGLLCQPPQHAAGDAAVAG